MFGIYSAMRNGFDIINATANKNAFDLYKYSRDNKDELAGQIGELKTEVAVLKATRPYQDALIQCDIRRVAEHADFNLWRRTCRMISGEIAMVERKVIIDKLNELVDSKITIIADTNPFLKIFKPFIDKAANNYICKINKFLQMIEEENGLIDIETLLGKSIDNLIVSSVQEYPDMLKGVTIGNGKIRIGLPGINKDIVLDANDIETFKQSLVK